MATMREYTYKTLRLSEWQFEAAVAQEGIAQWFPVRPLCQWLGIDSRTQLGVLKHDSRYAQALREIPLLTAAGWRATIWLRRDRLALWLLGIDPKRCQSLRTRDQLETFQIAVMRAAEALLFGEQPGVPPAPVVTPASFQASIPFTCPTCRQSHVLVYHDGDVRVEHTSE